MADQAGTILAQMIKQNATASEEMASTAEELSSQAEQLQDTIAYFRIDNQRQLSTLQGEGKKPAVGKLDRKTSSAPPGPVQQFRSRPAG